MVLFLRVMYRVNTVPTDVVQGHSEKEDVNEVGGETMDTGTKCSTTTVLPPELHILILIAPTMSPPPQKKVLAGVAALRTRHTISGWRGNGRRGGRWR